MNAIIHPQQQILDYLGGPQKKKDGVKYRLSNLLEFEEVNGIKIIYNGLTQSLVSVNNAEYQDFLDLKVEKDFVDFMFRNYFMVEEDFNEADWIWKYRKEKGIKVDENYLKTPFQYTILTTTSCNARCFYCYEKGVKKKVMSVETAEKIADYIIDKYNKSDKKKSVSIGWFGGEPTVNTKVIDIICHKLKDNGVNFRSNFTTNGYLFDEKMCKKAREEWMTVNAQVTIDGTEKIYNRAKNYVYDQEKEGSPFNKVISNIRRMLDYGITVNVRINMDEYNSDDILKLVDILYDEVGPRDGFSAYCYPLFDGYGISRGIEKEFTVFKKCDEASKKLENRGIGGQGGVARNGISLHHCMVDGGEEIMFAPDGSMGLCEHYTENNFIGHIDDPDNIDWDVVKKFKEQVTDRKLCSDCPCLPDCVKLKMCQDLRDCDEAKKWWHRSRLRSKMRYDYFSFGRQNNQCNCGSNGDLLKELKELKNFVFRLSDRVLELENKIKDDSNN